MVREVVVRDFWEYFLETLKANNVERIYKWPWNTRFKLPVRKQACQSYKTKPCGTHAKCKEVLICRHCQIIM
jgi:hypothetical protein